MSSSTHNHSHSHRHVHRHSHLDSQGHAHFHTHIHNHEHENKHKHSHSDAPKEKGTLKCENISFGYDKNSRILRNVNLEIQRGEVVWLKGPSGSGKSTLCKVIAGYESPSNGAIYHNDKPLQMLTVQYIGQHPELALNPRMQMKSALAEAGHINQDLIEHLGICGEWLTRYPHELSGGQLQRFCIARALAANPYYIIADEITTMLDPLSQARIWHVLRDEAEARNLGLLITTHSQALGELLATRVIELSTINDCSR